MQTNISRAYTIYVISQHKIITTIYSCPARCYGDILFLIDNSDAVDGLYTPSQNAVNFEKIKAFMINLIQRVTISPDLVRVSVVTYSSSGNVRT